jgi:CCR4-NOT complex subunit CAF16
MGLMTEWNVLLLDEVGGKQVFPRRLGSLQVTVDLDVLVRSDLIDFLISESETRKATIVCTLPDKSRFSLPAEPRRNAYL